MQDALVLLDSDWKRKYSNFITIANYFTFTLSIDEFIAEYKNIINNVVSELMEIDKIITQNSIVVEQGNFIELPFIPKFRE